MRIYALLLISAIPAYILGSANGAIIASKYFYRKDIRNFGSGNPGLTNFYRVFGKGGTLLVILIDVFKTIAPVIFGGWLFGRHTSMAQTELWLFGRVFVVSLFGQTVSGFFVMLGHCFPVFYKFRGGKGVMALGAILIILDWRLALISWGTFVLLTAITRFISLSAIIGAALFPVAQLLLKHGGVWEISVSFMCTALLIARHEANIRRLIKGEESKFRFRS
jgi:glycerol-3-phosphate acyltransferase PlsY